MSYRDGLRQTNANLDPLGALRSPTSVLLGVSASAAQAIEGLGIRTVLDLATDPLFATAATIAAAARGDTSLLAPLGGVPGGLINEGGPTDLPALARAELKALRALSETVAASLKQQLQIDTIGDLGRWPPYRAALEILGAAGVRAAAEKDEASELVPKLGEFPTERHFYSTIVLDQIARQDTADLTTAGAIDLSPALSADFGFSTPAVGARLTFEQSWYAQGVTLGNLLHSLALAPGESTRIALLDWSRQQSAATSEAISETEKLANTTTHNRALSEVQDAVAHEAQRGFSHTESSSDTRGGGLSGGFALGPIQIGASASGSTIDTSADSWSTSSGSRTLAASMSQKVMDSTQQAASSARNRRASIVQEVSQQEHESVSTRIVANYNHMHALTVQYYEVVELYRVAVTLCEVERCLFIPFKLLTFTNQVVERYQGVLAGAALDRRARELLTNQFGSVRLTPSAAVRPLVSGHRAVLATAHPEVLEVADVTPADPAATPATPATPPAATETHRMFEWNSPELSRAARITSGTVAGFDSASIYLAAGTTMRGLTLTTDRPGPVIKDVSLRLSGGAQPVTLTRTSIGWRTPSAVALDIVSEISVTTEGQGSFEGTMSLELEYLATHFPITLPVVAGGNSTTVACTLGGSEVGPELLQHLNANRLYYNQAIWRSLDASTTALLLSAYRFEGQPVANLIDPAPIQIAGNYLTFRMPGFVARRNLAERTTPASADDASRTAWRAWLDEKGLDFGPENTTEQLVPIPTGGVFAEAVLGRSNSAEKLDATRFWNWQDSPIPLQPPEIAAITMESRAQAVDVRPGQLGQPVLNIVNPSALPDPAGLNGIVTALQNGNMFRDMSGLATTIGLAQAMGGNVTSSASDAAKMATASLQIAAQRDVEKERIAAQVIMSLYGTPGSTAGTPKNTSEMGALLNTAEARDQQKAPGVGGGSGGAPLGSGSGGGGTGGTSPTPAPDLMPGSDGSFPGTSGGSRADTAFNRALWGHLGVPASSIVAANAPTPNTSNTAPPVTPHLSESELKEWVHKALEGAHVIGSVAEVIEIFHASGAWPAISASLSWAEAAAVGEGAAAGAGALATFVEIAIPIGYVALIAVTFLEFHESFSTGERVQEKKGLCYGLAWAASGMPDRPRTFEPWGVDTAEELRAAWEHGLKTARQKFKTDIELHNQVLLRLAYETMMQPRHKWTDPGGRLLNVLWDQVKGADGAGMRLDWINVGSEYADTHVLNDLKAPNEP
jgi:hypothetical protein